MAVSEGDAASAIRCLRRARDEWQGIGEVVRGVECALFEADNGEHRGDADGGDDRQPPLELLVLRLVVRFLVLVVPVLEHHPGQEQVDDDEDENLKALLRTARQLHPADLEELRKYAEFRRARGIYQGKTRPRAGRKGGKHK